MNFFQAIFLGLVQALTEYLPVSSSAHIRIIGDLMLGSDPGAAFTAIIQIGTELAVILYFRHDIIRILGAWFGSLFGKEGKDFKSRMGAHNRDTQMGWFIIIGTLPILIAGLLFKDAIESTLRNLWITVTVLIIFGILLWVVDARAKQVKTMDEMTWKDALIFGIGQMLALIPGVSRSGGTITFGRAMGYTREAAVRVSFLMAIPAVFGAGILEAVSAVKDVAAGNAGVTSPNAILRASARERLAARNGHWRWAAKAIKSLYMGQRQPLRLSWPASAKASASVWPANCARLNAS